MKTTIDINETTFLRFLKTNTTKSVSIDVKISIETAYINKHENLD